jgi:hypothetical protein
MLVLMALVTTFMTSPLVTWLLPVNHAAAIPAHARVADTR